jgi:L-histidine N-alpha-methyltransferase
MNFSHQETLTRNRLSITNLLQEIGHEEVVAEIVAGLESGQKSISSKYFYNKRGSLLFEEITRLKEYYPTRTEKAILKQIAPGLMKQYGDYEIIELGPGDHSKISILLSAAADLEKGNIRYLPLDISKPALNNSAQELVRMFPELHVEGYAIDFLSQFELLNRERPAMICFFGSTIGNFERETSLELLMNISRQMKQGDILLLGMDMVKAESVLHLAYNDSRGVTREFNLNILNSVNDLIQSDLNTDDFEHLAFYNREKSRIEMHLVAQGDIVVHSPFFDQDILLEKGETIHTENSHKYNAGHVREITAKTGLRLNHTHTDSREWFSLMEFQKV